MKRYLLYILYVATSLIMACNSVPEGVEPEPKPEACAIGFGVADSGTRSIIINNVNDSNFRAKAFRVFAEHTPQGGTPTDVFNDVDVKYDGIYTGWNYDGAPKMWAEDGSYVFRGYWPSTTSLASATATTSSLVLEYSVTRDNDDLMVGYYTCPTRNPDKNGIPQYVGLEFYHALSGVRIALHVGENAKASYRVKNVYFTSLIYINSLSYTQTVSAPIDFSYWSASSGVRSENDEFGVDRLREWRDGDEGVDGLVPSTINDEDPQYLYLPWQLMIPQSLLVTGSIHKPSVVVEIETTLDGSVHTSKKELVLPTPAGLDKWLPGKLYTYTISLRPEDFNITVQSVDWDRVNGVAPDLEF